MSRTKKCARKGQAGRDGRAALKLRKAHERAKKVAVATPPVKTTTKSDVPRLSKKEKKRRQREHGSIESDSATANLPPAKRTKGDDGVSRIRQEEGPAALDMTDQPLQSHDSIAGTRTEDLANSHEVTTMNIMSSSKVEAKVTHILHTLASFSFVTSAKPNVIKLHAKGATGSKLISIVEISKRNIELSGGKWFQYNRVGQVLETKESTVLDKKITTILGHKVDAHLIEGNDDSRDGEESDFESMKTPFERALEGRAKVRAVPTMTTYLSRVSIQNLKSSYGEQTNAPTM